MENKPIIGISAGDLNGIGLEVILKTFDDSGMMDFCTPVLFASSKAVSFHRKALNMDKFIFHSIYEIDKIIPGKPNLFNCWKEDVIIEFGKESKVAGSYAALSLDIACGHLEKNEIDALVTAPINKASIQSENFNFSGHTDYLESRFKGKATMMLISEEMKMALATVHIPLNKVATAINEELILEKLESINQTLLRDFQLRKGRIAVLALNPHAGDNGVIGNEDDTVIKPAIDKSMEKGILAFGPYAADSFFGSGNYKNFDAVLAMYHDQGLIPFKSLSFGKGVNYTSNLDIIRTSPDHGTGFDIAGKGIAKESSFREAIMMACNLVRNRRVHNEISKNPLKLHRGHKDN